MSKSIDLLESISKAQFSFRLLASLLSFSICIFIPCRWSVPVVMLRVKIIYRATSGGDGLEPNSIMEAEEKE